MLGLDIAIAETSWEHLLWCFPIVWTFHEDCSSRPHSLIVVYADRGSVLLAHRANLWVVTEPPTACGGCDCHVSLADWNIECKSRTSSLVRIATTCSLYYYLQACSTLTSHVSPEFASGCKFSVSPNLALVGSDIRCEGKQARKLT